MLFSSYEFIFLFLPVVVSVYYLLVCLNRFSLAKLFLVVSSLFMYAWWSPVYIFLILISIWTNFTIGKILNMPASFPREKTLVYRKAIFFWGVIFNLSLLGYFKYYNFIIITINDILNLSFALHDIVLPLAISFFTFQQIAYLADSYRYGNAQYTLSEYMLFVSFFPQLIAGPIVHHKEMIPQFQSVKNVIFSYHNFTLGIFIFTIGLFKKVVLADTFSEWANAGFGTQASLNFFEAWFTSLSYTFQLYFDFSGYVDMALGLALLFNIRLPINFNSPYKAFSIKEFWRRWHITLSRFLRDYVYIPMGGNKVKLPKECFNILITFLIGGLWHGASWMFVAWGAMHGGALVIHKLWSLFGFRLWGWLSWLITFNFINLAWIFFRAEDLESVHKIITGMLSFDNIVMPGFLSESFAFLDSMVQFGYWLQNINGAFYTPFLILASFFIVLYFNNTASLLKGFNITVSKLLYSMVLFFISFVYLGDPQDFLYFNF